MGQRKFRSKRCEGCGLLLDLCVCERMPRLDLKTAMLVVQNNHERHKPTNTGRLVDLMLVNCELTHYAVRGVVFDESPLQRPERDYILIFPRAEGDEPAPILEPAQFEGPRPKTVVMLDGTWGQCSRMSRRIDALAKIPAFALPPGPPSHWGVRRTDDPARVSTLEAAIRVMRIAEGPEVARQMQDYFDLIAARSQFMKGLLKSPEVPEAWRNKDD